MFRRGRMRMRPMILLTALVLGGAVAPAGLCAHAEVRISAETFTAMSGKTVQRRCILARTD